MEPARACHGDTLDTEAAVAELLHLDGAFEEAATMWSRLALSGYRPPESTLKAAVSYLSLGNRAEAMRWLLRSRKHSDRAEVLYVLAQEQWNRGRSLKALKTLAVVRRGAPTPGRETTLLGVFARRLNHTAQALALFRESASNGDTRALCNIVSILCKTTDLDSGLHALAEAVALDPQQIEPYVLCSRLSRRFPSLGRPEIHLARARLRQRSIARYRDATITPHITASVLVRMEPNGLKIRVEWVVDHKTSLPESFVLNRGYQSIRINGKIIDGTPLDAHIAQYTVPWQDRAPASNSLTLELEGLPQQPGARYDPHESEFDAISAWLPIPAADYAVSLNLSAQAQEDVHILASAGKFGGTIIAVESPTVYKATPSLTIYGRCSAALLYHAAGIIRGALDLWQTVLPSPEHVSVFVADRTSSQFCYTRPGLLRVASGTLRGKSTAQLIHKTGHLWWNADERFTPESRWLAEALAEYGLHMADSAGLVREYRASVLTALRTLGDGRLPAAGLYELSKDRSKPGAFRLRAKGAFMLAALRATLGDSSFWSLIAETYAHSRTNPIDSYTFFAIAARLKGCSLNWFARQWVFETSELIFSARDAHVTQTGVARWELTFIAACDGIGVPGSAVRYAVVLQNGSVKLADVNLNLGIGKVVVSLEQQPIKITPDPFLEWYGTSVTYSLEDSNGL